MQRSLPDDMPMEYFDEMIERFANGNFSSNIMSQINLPVGFVRARNEVARVVREIDEQDTANSFSKVSKHTYRMFLSRVPPLVIFAETSK